jgi:nicotinate-nucleotide adenylyltransferase
MKIAVFGSAFNPPTYSHLKIIEHLSTVFDKVLVIPCYSHNFGKKMIDFKHRLEMARLLIKDTTSNVEISDIESHLFKEEVSRTYPLLKALKSQSPEDDFIFVCGVDNGSPENWPKFYKHDLIDKEFGKYVMPDQGMTRSTLVRETFTRGEPIDAYTKQDIIDYLKTNSVSF